jgi:hypothetical protein
MGIKEAFEDAARRAAQAQKDAVLESVVSLQGALFDKASAYTNIIIAAGYVATFTLWSRVSAIQVGPLPLNTVFATTWLSNSTAHTGIMCGVFWRRQKKPPPTCYPGRS